MYKNFWELNSEQKEQDGEASNAQRGNECLMKKKEGWLSDLLYFFLCFSELANGTYF